MEIVKGRPLTKEETKALVQLVENSKVINIKSTNALTNRLKNEEWINITEIFNANYASCPRSPHQLRLKWENLKKQARNHTEMKINNSIDFDTSDPLEPRDKELAEYYKAKKKLVEAQLRVLLQNENLNWKLKNEEK